MKVCIIGAGTGGLCSAKHVLQNNMEPTIFEQSDEAGGTWVYNENIGTDSYGIDVHSSMYKGLRTNLPKEIMGYPDFPIPEQKQSYIPAADMLDFLNKYAEHFNIKKHIKFLHYVIRVRPRNGEYEVIVKDLVKSCINTLHFDYVMVCNGHYHTPEHPIVSGSEVYKGKQIHSHDYRCPTRFKNETVLVIGAGPSGMDLAHEISKTAVRVTLSHHLPSEPKTKFQSNVNLKPDVVKLTENGAVFNDGSEQTFSIVFFCTGYKYSFPFLSVDCGIYVEENYVKPLYKHCINIRFPTMAFIGLPFYVCASQMMDLQARFALSIFTENTHLPSLHEMLLDTDMEMEARWKKGYKKRQAHMMGEDQNKYYTDLSLTANITNIKPVMTKLHNESSERFLDDLVNFRKDIYKIIDDETFIQIN